MTTAELVAAIHAADPSGKLPVCVGGEDIYFVEKLPGYYDGHYEQLVHDPELRGRRWSIIGGRISRRGEKVKIHVLSIQEALYEHPEMPVDLDVARRDDVAETVEQWRKAGREA